MTRTARFFNSASSKIEYGAEGFGGCLFPATVQMSENAARWKGAEQGLSEIDVKTDQGKRM